MFVLSFILSGAVYSEDQGKKQLELVEKKYDSITDYRAEFEQKTVLGMAGQTVHGSGVVYIKKAGKIRWEYTTPEPQVFIMDGRSFWLYLPEEKQVMKDDYSVVPEHILIDLFSEKVDIQKNFNVLSVEYPEVTSDIVIKLEPLSETPSIKNITLYVERNKHYIQKTIIEDEFSNTTIISFSKITVDSGLDDKLFRFVPPEDVEIFKPF